MKNQDPCPACGEGYVEGKRGYVLSCVTCAARFEQDEDKDKDAPTEAQKEQRCNRNGW